MSEKTIRIVSCAVDGSLRIRDHQDFDSLKSQYEQYGVDDCNTELSLRGYPLFRGLVGPIAEGKRVARYETPDVFEALTKEWAKIKTRRRARAVPAVETPAEPVRQPVLIPAMHFNFNSTTIISTDLV